MTSPSVPKTLKRLSKTYKNKSKAYGPQERVVCSILDAVLKKGKPIRITNGEEAWKFHLFMEVLCKCTRISNLFVNDKIRLYESLVDSLEDESLYCAMLASKVRRKNGTR